MSNIKERLLGAITVMDEATAQKVWNFVLEQVEWNSIEETEPDKIDLQMLRESKIDPDCHEFASEDDVRRVLG